MIHCKGDSVKTLGSFGVPSGRLVVADPVYLTNKDLAVVINNAMPGRWIALARIGSRVLSLFAFHESDSVRDAHDDRELTFRVGVDSGRVCVVDSQSIESYKDASLRPGFACDPFGVMVPSGFGDGIYDCRVREYAGQAVSVAMTFIDSEVWQ